MKRKIACLLALALALCSATALAELGNRLKVVNCNEYVTLRAWPDTSAEALARVPLGKTVDDVGGRVDGFAHVSFRGVEGYVLSDYLRVAEDYTGTRVDPSDRERYNINLFLSNFTETGFCSNCCYDKSSADDATLTRFAIEHCWFNRPKQLEWGEYFDYNNVRLPRNQIAPVVKKYFGLDITPSKSPAYIDYRDGWYYWQETGGHTNEGFACLTLVERLDKRRYSVWFEIFGMGENWDNDVCYWIPAEVPSVYQPYGESPLGHAVIDTGSGGLGDRSTWSLERYTMRFDW